jgi:hypothetical protein
MQHYGVFDDNGVPTGFYLDEIHVEKGEEGSKVPDEAVEITTEDWEKYITGGYYRDPETELCTECQVDSEALLTEAVSNRKALLNNALQEYINGYYDSGTQTSFQNFYILSDTPAEVKASIEDIWSWIQAVVTYYYTCKAEIDALEDVATVEAYQWDFSTFDATVPDVTLRAIYEGMAAG